MTWDPFGDARVRRDNRTTDVRLDEPTGNESQHVNAALRRAASSITVTTSIPSQHQSINAALRGGEVATGDDDDDRDVNQRGGADG